MEEIHLNFKEVKNMAETTILVRLKNSYDSAQNWTTNNPVLLSGEIGIESDTNKFKFGDGTSTWEELDYAGTDASQIEDLIEQNADNFYVLDASGSQDDTTVLGTIEEELKKGDIAVVRRAIGGEAKSYTAYVYNGSVWGAADGNYNAENVYFGKDLTITANIGVQTIGSTGSKTLSTTGKNLKQVLDMIVAEEKNPTVTQPSVSVTCNQMKAYEVGTSVTPQYTVTLNPGSYQYGPATGVTATSYNVTDTKSGSSTTATGSFSAFTVGDGENYSISATVQHSAGATPKTNLGNDYAAGAIQAGSKSGSKGTITGYRNSFYGTTTNKETPTTSSVIRSLSGKSNKALANGNTFTVTIPTGALRVLIAYPATLRDVTSIKDVNGLNAEISSGFTKSTVQVDGASGYTAIEYKVYTMDYANANDTANTYTVTI